MLPEDGLWLPAVEVLEVDDVVGRALEQRQRGRRAGDDALMGRPVPGKGEGSGVNGRYAGAMDWRGGKVIGRGWGRGL